MRVLLTGSTGFLGKYVCKELEKEGIEYYGWESIRDGDMTDWRDIQETFSSSEYLTKNPFSHICHLAAKCGGIKANLNSGFDYIRDNLLMGLNVIDLALELKSTLILISTVCAYPSKTVTPFKEEDLELGPPEISNKPYGISKRTLMEVLRAARIQYGLKSVSLLMANLYGIGMDDSPNGHVIPEIFRKCVEYKKGLAQQVTLFGDGTCSRDMLNVRDAAKAIIKTLKLQNGPTDVLGVNIGSGEESPINRIAYYITELMGVPMEKVVWGKKEENGQQRRVLNCERASTLLGWKSEIELYEGLRELSNFYKEQI
jgi:GDP-L-fucose synthase